MGYQATLIALSTIAIALLIPPFIWHARTVNIPLITLLCWLLIMDINIFICAIIWGGEDFMDVYDGDIYCDVMVKLSVGANVGISSSVAGVLFNLYRVLKADAPLPGLHSFKKIATDLAISLGTPIVIMALNYLVQVRRYTIFQYSGCLNVVDLSWPTIVIYSMWLVIWALIGGIISVMIVLKYFQKRKDVKDILRCTNSGLNIVRFARLLLFCCVVVLVMLPLSLYLFVDGISSISQGYDYEFVHSPALWNLVTYVSTGAPYIITWVYLALSYMTFIFFGLGSDAIEMYLQMMNRVGLRFIVTWIQNRRSQTRFTRADKLVATVLGSSTIATPTGNGTHFDMEMQRIMEEDDEKSPTSTQVSDVLDGGYKPYGGNKSDDLLFDDLQGMDTMDDEEVRNYINRLYEEDQNAASYSMAETDVTLSSPNFNNAAAAVTINTDSPFADPVPSNGNIRSNAVEDYGYSRRITHYAP